jgi:hypothetical protein
MFKIIYKSTDTTIIELAYQSQVDAWKETYPNDVALVTIDGEPEPEPEPLVVTDGQPETESE